MTLTKIGLLASVSCASISLIEPGAAIAWGEPTTMPSANPLAGQPVARIGTKTTGFAVSCFALAPDGDVVALGGNDGKVRLWSLAGSKVTGTIDRLKNGYIGSVAFSSDGTRLVIHADYETIQLWDLKLGKEIAHSSEALLTVEQLCFAAGGRKIGVVSDSEGLVWDLDSGKIWKSEQPVSSLAFSPDGKILALGFNTLRLLDVASRRTFQEYGKMDGRVASLQFSPTGNQILAVDSACPGTTVRLLECDSGDETIIGEKIRSDRVGAGYSAGSKTIVVSNESSQLVFWDAFAHQKLETLAGIERSTNTLIFTPDRKQLLTGCNDAVGDLLIWDVTEVLSTNRTAQ